MSLFQLELLTCLPLVSCPIHSHLGDILSICLHVFHLFEILQTARDEIQSLEDFHNVGWLRVDLQPIKQVLTTYAAKWMWTYTKYLSDQVCMQDNE